MSFSLVILLLGLFDMIPSSQTENSANAPSFYNYHMSNDTFSVFVCVQQQQIRLHVPLHVIPIIHSQKGKSHTI